MDSSLGANLRRIRKEKKLTLKQLSEQTNLSVSFLSSIERGERSASLKALKSIAKALDVTVYVLTGEPPIDLDEYDAKVELTDLIALRSEEHTSELQSRENLVCRLLLEKKKKK